MLLVMSKLLLKFSYFRMIAILWGRDFETKSVVLGFYIAKTLLKDITVHFRVIVFSAYARQSHQKIFFEISTCQRMPAGSCLLLMTKIVMNRQISIASDAYVVTR